jgi:hypothetical protein
MTKSAKPSAPESSRSQQIEQLTNAVQRLADEVRLAREVMDDVCEELRLTYTFGFTMNPVLQWHTEELLEKVRTQFAETQQPQREFTCWPYQAQTWLGPRCLIVKVEANAEGTNRRAVITNRPGGPILPAGSYEEYANRGESENRHKELKRKLHGDRLSDHRFLANYFRLLMHALAYNFLVCQRRLIANPPDVPQELDEDVAPPAEALAGRRRRQYFNHRRERDALGEGHITTWRTRIIKVAAEVVTSTRRIVLRLSSTWPHLKLFEQVAKAVLSLTPT